jgi:DNA mismatch endonuclease (patch repair protein)
VFRRARVAVFVDGCFWHGCPDHFRPPRTNADYWGPKVERNRARDRDTDDRLLVEGWTVVRVWEHEAVATALARILAAVGRAEPRSMP